MLIIFQIIHKDEIWSKKIWKLTNKLEHKQIGPFTKKQPDKV